MEPWAQPTFKVWAGERKISLRDWMMEEKGGGGFHQEWRCSAVSVPQREQPGQTEKRPLQTRDRAHW